jgi:hypothetical protein
MIMKFECRESRWHFAEIQRVTFDSYSSWCISKPIALVVSKYYLGKNIKQKTQVHHPCCKRSSEGQSQSLFLKCIFNIWAHVFSIVTLCNTPYLQTASGCKFQYRRVAVGHFIVNLKHYSNNYKSDSSVQELTSCYIAFTDS